MSRRFVAVRVASMLVVAMFAVSAYALNGNYTRPLVTLNCISATGGTGSANVSSVTSLTVPPNSVITKVVLTGSKSGATANWRIKHVASGKVASAAYVSSTTGAVITTFNGLTPETKWEVWFECSNGVTTITNGQLKVEYTYP